MGKYDERWKAGVSDEANMVSSLIFIANELAEANRLKRLELKFTPIGDRWTPDVIKDLEDQA